MRKFFMITALVIMGALTACSSDDNNGQKDLPVTWVADDLMYSFNGMDFKHKFIEMPGDYAVSENDKIVITADQVILYEHRKSVGAQTSEKGIIKDKMIVFENQEYPNREIREITETRMTLVYDITMRGATLPVTVTYNKQ